MSNSIHARNRKSCNSSAHTIFFVLLLLPGLTPAADNSASMQQIEVNGYRFDVWIAGPEDGRPVLLLHGFPQHAASWNEVVNELTANGFRTVVPNQRGYSPGARPTAYDQYTMDAFMSDALGIMDELEIERFDLAGFGLGAILSWHVAATHPERLRTLTSLREPHPAAFAKGIFEDEEQTKAFEELAASIEVNSNFGVAERANRQLANNAEGLRALLRDNGMEDDDISIFVQRLSQPGVLAGAMSWHLTIDLDWFASVPSVKVPTLFVWTEGTGLTAETARTAVDYVDAPFRDVFLEDTHHWLLENESEIVSELLVEHLNQY